MQHKLGVRVNNSKKPHYISSIHVTGLNRSCFRLGRIKVLPTPHVGNSCEFVCGSQLFPGDSDGIGSGPRCLAASVAGLTGDQDAVPKF